MPRDPTRLPGRRWYGAADPDLYDQPDHRLTPHRKGARGVLPRRRILDCAAAGVRLSAIAAVAEVPEGYYRECLADPYFFGKFQRARGRAAAADFDALPDGEKVALMDAYRALDGDTPGTAEGVAQIHRHILGGGAMAGDSVI